MADNGPKNIFDHLHSPAPGNGESASPTGDAVTESEFFPILSQEIRTPLNTILGLGDLLLETRLTEEQRRYVEVLKEVGGTVLSLLDGLADVSGISAGRVSIQDKPFLLYGVIGGCFAMFEQEASTKEIEFAVEIDENVPVFVRGDPHRIHQALVILLGNAVKFTKRGFVQISVAPCPDGSGRIRFTVSDSGAGISPDRHAGLFENLPPVNMAVLRRHTKKGLGLPVCRRIIEAMGGRMGFQSNSGKGSSFWFDVLLPEAGESYDPEMLSDRFRRDLALTVVSKQHE
jgi:signal transduction histidine kinase